MTAHPPESAPAPPSPMNMPARRPTRVKPSLADGAPVVRGGRLNARDLVRSASQCEELHGKPGLSVQAANVSEHGEVVEMAGDRLRHGEVACTRAIRLRDAGFRLEQTFDAPHHTVWLAEERIMHDADRAIEAIMRFCGCFDPPVPRDTLVA